MSGAPAGDPWVESTLNFMSLNSVGEGGYLQSKLIPSPAHWTEDHYHRLLLSGTNPVLIITWPLVLRRVTNTKGNLNEENTADQKKDTINHNNLREKEGQQGWKQKERNQTEETETVREEGWKKRNVGTQTPIKTAKYLFKSISLLSMVTVFGRLDGFFQGWDKVISMIHPHRTQTDNWRFLIYWLSVLQKWFLWFSLCVRELKSFHLFFLNHLLWKSLSTAHWHRWN